MGKLRVIKAGLLATVQDKGRFGYRKYGIPQSGAMDMDSMQIANQLVGNEKNWPVIEFALMGLKLEALEETILGVVGALFKVNGKETTTLSVKLHEGDAVEIAPPSQVYAYLSIGGNLQARYDFGSYSTYLMAGLGGIEGRTLKAEDILETEGNGMLTKATYSESTREEITTLRIIKGPEWNGLKEGLVGKTFEINPSSNRMGIRLKGDSVECRIKEIRSSAVIPGTIQLPSNGQPIILMNDCQTTGGYPRIGKVVDEDLGKLAQMRGGNKIKFI